MRLLRRTAAALPEKNAPRPSSLWERLEDANALIAHRCAGFSAPENTIFALRQASQDGAVAVEVDVCLSADNVPHIIHDQTVDRTTDGSGPGACRLSPRPELCGGKIVRGFSAQGLRALNAAAKFASGSANGAGGVCQAAHIPTLEEFIEEALRLRIGVFIDCKDGRTAGHVAALFKRYELLYEIGCVVSFNPYTLRAVRRLDERVPIMLTHRHELLSTSLAKRQASWWKVWIAGRADRMLAKAIREDLWMSLKACGVLLWKDDVNDTVVELWKERGLKVIAWTVNNNADKERLARLGVPCMTDVLTEEEAPEAD